MTDVPPNVENWQVDPPPKKSNSLIWVLVIVGVGGMCLIVMVFAVLLMPVFMRAKNDAQVRGCAGNARQLGIAMNLYAGENDDTLPLDNWTDSLRQYEDDSLVYSCPVQRRMDPETFGYAFFKPVVGKKLSDIGSPNTTPLVFDSTNTAKNAVADTDTMPKPGRHDNGNANVVCFVNGSTRTVRVGEEGALTRPSP